MKTLYSNLALADLRRISEDSRRDFGDKVTRALETRIRNSIERISRAPLSAQAVADRPGVHAVPLVRYPFKIFYRIEAGAVLILHIRHTSRRPV